MALKYQSMVLSTTAEDRDVINELREKYEERTNIAVIRKAITSLRDAIGPDATGGTKKLKAEISKAAKQAEEQKPFANGRPSTMQFSDQHIEFMEKAAEHLGLEDRSKLIRATIRVAAKGII